MFKENNYISYFRFYRDEVTEDDFSWWFCKADYKVYTTEEICKKFKYSSKQDIIDSRQFIEFYKIDIIKLKREYIQQNFTKAIVEDMLKLSDDKFDMSFNKLLDRENAFSSWYEFEYSTLKKAYIQWRKENAVNQGTNL